MLQITFATQDQETRAITALLGGQQPPPGRSPREEAERILKADVTNAVQRYEVEAAKKVAYDAANAKVKADFGL